MQTTENCPQLLYQKVQLYWTTNDNQAHYVHAKTTLILGYDNPPDLDSVIHINCRSCDIKSVSVNETPCSFLLNDPLDVLDIKPTTGGIGTSFLGDILDAKYRAALEITSRGELGIFPPSDGPIPPISKPVFEDVDHFHDDLFYFNPESTSAFPAVNARLKKLKTALLGLQNRSQKLHSAEMEGIQLFNGRGMDCEVENQVSNSIISHRNIVLTHY